MSSCNTNCNSSTTCTTATCSTSCASCTCCHVQNVTIDKQLCVGDETYLRTCGTDGGALIVQNGCCTQTSGNLAHICGEPGQVALKVESGKVEVDPNEDLSGDTVGVHIYNSTAQTDGELVKITGEPSQVVLSVESGKVEVDPNEDLSDSTIGVHIYNSTTQTDGKLVTITGDTDQTALAVLNGETHMIPDSELGNALYVANTAEQTGDELVMIDGTCGGQSGGVLLLVQGVTDQVAFNVQDGQTYLDPNSAYGGALTITNSEPQSSGELVSITGYSGQTALQVCEGQTRLDPNASDGGGLIITNSTDQSSGELVSITGYAGQTALQVCDGQTVLDPNASDGGALLVYNSDTQTTGVLVHIEGTTSQMALQVDDGDVHLDHVTSGDAVLTGGSIDAMPIGANTPSTSVFTTMSVDPSSSSGGAITVTNSATQSSADLMRVTGTSGQSALRVDVGDTHLGPLSIDPNSASGGGITITNTATQTSGNLVTITGESNEIALNVTAGNVVFQDGLDSTAIGANTPSTGAFTTLSVNAPAPSSSGDTAGLTDEIRVSGNYMYIYTGTEWRRAEFATF